MPSPSYESNQLLNEYLLMHYGSNECLMPWSFGPQGALNFPARTVSYFPDGEVKRSLDIGCAVGRSSFELSSTCQEVIGVDYSSSFVAAAKHLAEEGELHYAIKETGENQSRAVARPPAASLPDRCQFIQGDAMNLPDGLGLFDRVHAANLICRLPEPEKLLERLPEFVRAGGHLVLATPCTWLDEFTPSDHQPDGDTFDWLRAILEKDFSLEHRADEPFLIRETARKFQWSVSMLTLWQRKR